MKGIELLDTNILIYAFDTSEGEKHEICKGIVAKIFDGKKKGAVCLQNLSEFFITVTQKISKPLSSEDAQKVIDVILNSKKWVKLQYTDTALHEAIDITKTGMHFWDALIAATMRENGIFTIITEDSDFDKVKWLTTINPLK